MPGRTRDLDFSKPGFSMVLYYIRKMYRLPDVDPANVDLGTFKEPGGAPGLLLDGAGHALWRSIVFGSLGQAKVLPATWDF